MKITPPSYIKKPSGRMGDIVFFNRYGRDYARTYVIPANPDTPEQRIVRKTFGDAVRSWQGLTDDEKSSYNRRAGRMNMSGYNLYISNYMNKNLTANLPGNSPLITHSDESVSALLRNRSVIAPSGSGKGLFKSNAGTPEVPV